MSGNHKKAFVSWSGGKDSALACYNAIKNDKVNVAYLLNMLSENGTHSRSHHLSAAVLKTQTGAMGIPIVQRQATWGGYEEEFKKALAFFKEEGIQTGIFGDIDVQEHRDWVERVCGDCGLNAIFPLWQRSRESLMDEFIAAGFKAVIVAVKLECMGRHKAFFTGYRPQFYIRTLDVTGNIALPEGVEMVMPGDDVNLTVELIVPVALEQGSKFAIREGGLTVGAGVVTKILE